MCFSAQFLNPWFANLFYQYYIECLTIHKAHIILGDPDRRADSGGEGKSKRAEKYGTKKTRLDFPSPPLSAPGSPRMGTYPSEIIQDFLSWGRPDSAGTGND